MSIPSKRFHEIIKKYVHTYEWMIYSGFISLKDYSTCKQNIFRQKAEPAIVHWGQESTTVTKDNTVTLQQQQWQVTTTKLAMGLPKPSHGVSWHFRNATTEALGVLRG